MDIVLDGFVHLQRYHIREVARGLAEVSNYRLREEFTACNTVLPPVSALAVSPEHIDQALQQPSAEVMRNTRHSLLMFMLSVSFILKPWFTVKIKLF